MNRRSVAFGVLCALCLTVAVGYALLRRAEPAESSAVPRLEADPAALADVMSRPHLLFRHTALDRAYGRLGVIPLDRLDGPRLLTSWSCERVDFVTGNGLCLVADRGMITKYRAELLDRSLNTRHTIPLGGVPSRTRVAPDGVFAALTYFVSGDSYAAAGFSTRTLLLDWPSGRTLANLEEFAITRSGAPFRSVDFNFWGVTFAKDPGKFYATLSSGGKMYLVEGNASARTARVMREGVECPSLSPDNRRIAFKRRMPGIILLWRIHVLDLDTGVETPLAETRSVDDQVEWLDDNTILYALPGSMRKASASMDIWAVPTDGSGAPQLFLSNAESPAVVR